jgi:hypothetical protein
VKKGGQLCIAGSSKPLARVFGGGSASLDWPALDGPAVAVRVVVVMLDRCGAEERAANRTETRLGHGAALFAYHAPGRRVLGVPKANRVVLA